MLKLNHQVLDLILEVLKDTTGEAPMQFNDIFLDAKIYSLLLNRDRKSAIDKLVSDKLISEIMFNGTICYYISFDGLLLIEKGGYVRKLRKDTISIVLQFLQLFLIAVGTVGLLIFEIVKYYLEHHHGCRCH